jgi:hypothetical protein
MLVEVAAVHGQAAQVVLAALEGAAMAVGWLAALKHLAQQIRVVVVVVMGNLLQAVTAAPASSSSPTSAHSNSVAATSQLMVATPFTRSPHREPCRLCLR